jgi:hypothetical protein
MCFTDRRVKCEDENDAQRRDMHSHDTHIDEQLVVPVDPIDVGDRDNREQ